MLHFLLLHCFPRWQCSARSPNTLWAQAMLRAHWLRGSAMPTFCHPALKQTKNPIKSHGKVNTKMHNPISFNQTFSATFKKQVRVPHTLPGGKWGSGKESKVHRYQFNHHSTSCKSAGPVFAMGLSTCLCLFYLGCQLFKQWPPRHLLVHLAVLHTAQWGPHLM